MSDTRHRGPVVGDLRVFFEANHEHKHHDNDPVFIMPSPIREEILDQPPININGTITARPKRRSRPSFLNELSGAVKSKTLSMGRNQQQRLALNDVFAHVLYRDDEEQDSNGGKREDVSNACEDENGAIAVDMESKDDAYMKQQVFKKPPPPSSKRYPKPPPPPRERQSPPPKPSRHHRSATAHDVKSSDDILDVDEYTRGFFTQVQDDTETMAKHAQDSDAETSKKKFALVRHLSEHKSPFQGENPPKPVEKNKISSVEIITELVSTEESYVDGLWDIIREYMDRLVAHEEIEHPIVPQQEIQKMFGNIREIHKMHSGMLAFMKEALLEPNATEEIPCLILRYGAFFRMYHNYAEQYRFNLEYIKEVREKNASFDIFIKVSDNVCGRTINDLLITPIQRIPRYRLLLEKVVEALQEEEKEYSDADAALNLIMARLDEVEEHMKIGDARRQLVNIQEEIFRGKVELVTSSRYCIRVSNLKIHVRRSFRISTIFRFRQFMFVLCNDLLLYGTIPKRDGSASSVKKILPLQGMTIGNFPDDDEIQFGFEIFHKNLDESITVICESNEEKTNWLNDLRHYIRATASAQDTFKQT